MTAPPVMSAEPQTRILDPNRYAEAVRKVREERDIGLELFAHADEAAQIIAALRAENARLREAAEQALAKAQVWRESCEVSTAIIAALQQERGGLRKRSAQVETALRLFIGCAYPVAEEINPRGHNWRGEASLDEALAEARKVDPPPQIHGAQP